MTNEQVMQIMTDLGLYSGGIENWVHDNAWVSVVNKAVAIEREACAKESLEVLDNLRKETIAQCQKGMIEAYKLGQYEEREACAKVCETDELCCKCGDECAAAIRARGEK